MLFCIPMGTWISAGSVKPPAAEAGDVMKYLDTQAEFEARGFIFKRGLLSPTEVALLREGIKSAQPLDPRNTRLNKDGLVFYHNLFCRSPALQAFISRPKIVEWLCQIIGPDFWVRWDQAVLKRPGGAEFPWHQDNGYNRLKDGHFQLWIALTDSRVENGGLWLQPGSHRRGVLPHKRVANHLVCASDPATAISVEAEAGDAILFSSLMVHYTSPNTSDLDRWAYVVEYMSLAHWDPFIKPPYFVVARNGRPAPAFVQSYRGKVSLRNQMKYLAPRIKMLAGRNLRKVRPGKRAPARHDPSPETNSDDRLSRRS